jgi:hypothetical protein
MEVSAQDLTLGLLVQETILRAQSIAQLVGAPSKMRVAEVLEVSEFER